MSNISISRPEVKQFYLEHKDSIPMLPARSLFSVIELPIQHSIEAENKTIYLLNTIKDSILQFDNFEYFAKKYSQDPGSKNNGGDLGYILRTLGHPGGEVADYSKGMRSGVARMSFEPVSPAG